MTRRIRRCLPPRASRPGAGWRAAVAASGELLEPRAALLRRLEEKSAQLEAKSAQLEAKSAQLEAANRDLAAREARLQAILDHEPECVKVVAADGTLLEINPAGLAMIEADDPAAFAGASIDALVTEAHLPAYRALRERVFRGDSGILEYELVGLRGGRRWLESHASPLRDADGTITALLAVTRDITARKRAEAALQTSEEWLRLAVRASNIGLFDWDVPTGRVLYSPEWKRLLGLADHEVGESLGEWERRVHPEDLARVMEVVNRHLARGEGSYEVEFRMRHVDGAFRWIYTRAEIVRGADGRPRRILGCHVDITARKRAEEALRESETRFRNVADHSPLILWMTDAAGLCTYANRTWYEFTGLTPAETLGHGWLQAVHEGDLQRVQSTFLAANAEARGIHVEYRLRRRDGAYRHVVDTAAPRRGPGGEYLGFVGSVLDVHERRVAEEALRESEERFRLVAETIDEVFYITNFDATRVIYVSPAYERVWGRRRGDLEASPQAWIEAIVADDRALVEGALAERSIGEYDEEYRIVRPDGSLRWVHDRAFVVGEGEAGRIVGVAQDITERKRVEEERRRLEIQIQHAQKLESLGVLAGGIAHDFNNLLTGILGYADLALFELPPASSARELVARVIDGARRAAELTGQMLAYSGKGHFVVEALDLSAVVRELARLLAVSVSKTCVLRYQLAPGLPAVEGDAAQVRQVLMNLVINASEAIGEASGVIEITTGAIYCDRDCLDEAEFSDALPEGEYVFLEVADDGVGMSEETRARIFDPFFTTKFTGRGLGLSAVLGIVRGHRGAIRCRSAPGEGTSFRVLLPATSRRAASPAEEGDRRGRLGSGAVLVVDDEPSVRGLARRMLEAMGFSVLAAADGLEAVEVFRAAAEKIRLVLLDLTMPRLDGAGAFRELRRIRPDVEVVLMSGYDEERATSRIAGDRVAGFLQKPFALADLTAAVQRALAGTGG